MSKETSVLSAMPGMKSPPFETICCINGEIHNISLNDYRGDWLILFFYPHDFDLLSPADLLGLNDQYGVLSKKNCKILAVSTDSCIIKEKFSCLSPSEGGVHGLKFPLAEDTDCEISRAYSVLKVGSGHSLRAYFIIDPKGFIQSRVMLDLQVGLGVKHLIRKVVSLQKVEKVSTSGKKMEQGQGNENMTDQIEAPGKEIGQGQGNDKVIKMPDQFETHLWYIENCIDWKRSGTYESPINIDSIDVLKCLHLDSFLLDYTLPNSQSSSSSLSTSSSSSSSFSPTSYYTSSPSSSSSSSFCSLVKNTGCSWQVDIPGELNNTLRAGPLSDKIFKLAYYTAHWGRSEHTVNEISYDGELHFVHFNTYYSDVTEASKHADGLAILAVFLQIDDKNKSETACLQLDKIVKILPNIRESGKSALTTYFVEHEKLIPADASAQRDYWTYFGSTTMGDMTENVYWIILKESVKIDGQFIREMQKLEFEGGMPMLANHKLVKKLGSGRHVMEPGYGKSGQQ